MKPTSKEWDLHLIGQSIEKWRSVLHGGKSGRSARSCALCVNYNPTLFASSVGTREEQLEAGCVDCPIKDDTGVDFCKGTAYVRYLDVDTWIAQYGADATGEAKISGKRYQEALDVREACASEMLTYLYELKVKYENKPEY